MEHNHKSNVTLNFVNPGLCHSELAREGSWSLWILKILLARTTEAGSRNYLWATQSGLESHGKYVSSCRVEEYVRPPLTGGSHTDHSIVLPRSSKAKRESRRRREYGMNFLVSWRRSNPVSWPLSRSAGVISIVGVSFSLY